jgi:hypothetical protein
MLRGVVDYPKSNRKAEYTESSSSLSLKLTKLSFKAAGGGGVCPVEKHEVPPLSNSTSINNGAAGIFLCDNPSGRTMALGSGQPPAEVSTRNISWEDKGGRFVGLTILPLSCVDCIEIWEPQPPGTLRACIGIA